MSEDREIQDQAPSLRKASQRISVHYQTAVGAPILVKLAWYAALMRKETAEKLADHVADWAQRGLIDSNLHERLKQRYSVDLTMGGVLLRWLGFLALFMLGSSVLGLIGMSMGEFVKYIAPFGIGAMAWIAWLRGVEMTVDPTQRFPISGAVLVTFSLLAGFTAGLAFYGVFGGDQWRVAIPVMMLLTATVAGLTAYRFRLRWPLALAILLIFHGLGNMHRYGGGGSYYMGIDDERLTLIAGLLSVLIGLWHERQIEREDGSEFLGFGQTYIVFGLLYVNLSAWFLSLPRGHLWAVILFTALSIAQILIGGRRFDGRFIGFGIVFLSINFYTRMFERFWDDLSKGIFFLVAGIVALAVGIIFEYRARRLTQGSDV